MEENLADSKPQNIVPPGEGRLLTKRERRELAKQEKQTERLKDENTKKLKKWGVWLLLLIILGFGGYKLWQWINTPQQGTGTSDALSAKSDDWVKGNPDAKVMLIEYADFECPACKIYSTEVLPKLADDYKDSLKFVYRHFPLPQHKKAVDAAKASEAAGFQGKFWEMHDLLYRNQEDWTSGNLKEKLVGYAQELGLNIDQFNKDFDSSSISQSIKDDETEGYSLRIDSTPTFFVNGKKASVNNGYDDLKKAVDQALSASN